MMSTPISRIRSQPDEGDDIDDVDDIEDFEDGGSDDYANMHDSMEQPAPGHDDDFVQNVPVDRRPKTRRRPYRAYSSDANRYAGASGDDIHAPSAYAEMPRRGGSRANSRFGAPLWRIFISRPFCQAVALAFAIILAVSLSPLAAMVIDRLPAVDKFSWARDAINSVISAIIITVMRPPSFV